jgi:hypothetical protein
MPRLVKKCAIGIKTESTQGSAVSLSATDFLLAEDVEVRPLAEVLPRDYYRSDLDTLAHVKGRKSFEVKFRTELKGSGTAGDAYDPLGAALQACGFTEAVSAGVSVTYTPNSAPSSANYYGPGNSCTIKVYKDGKELVIAGAVGSFKASFEAGKICMLDFTFRGVYTEPTDVAFPSQTYSSVVPAIVASASFSVHSFSAVVEKFDFDVANELTERPSVSAANGLLGFMITGRKPTGSMDPEDTPTSDTNWYNRLTAGTSGALSLTLGATAGNIVGLSFPAVQYAGLTHEGRGGISVLNIPLQFNRSSGNDWLTITMT